MATSPRPTIGVLAAWHVFEGTTVDAYLHTLLRAVQAAGLARGCNLLLACGVAPPPPPHLATLGWPVPGPGAQFLPVGPWNADGLLVVPNTLSAERMDYLAALIGGGYPVVFAGAPEVSPGVVVDNAGGIAKAVAHLAAHGHRDIAFLGSSASRNVDTVERVAAYREAMAALGLRADPQLIALGSEVDDVSGGRAALARVLASGRPFSAVLTYNDLYAVGAMEAARSRGLRVPEDIAVIGFDDRPVARVQTPALTTIRHPTWELGYRSLCALLDLIAGCWDGRTQIRIPTELVLRQSCGCAIGVMPVTEDAYAASPREISALPGNADPGAGLIPGMAHAALAEARISSYDQLLSESRRLADAVFLSAETGDRAAFETALAAVLQAAEARDEDPFIWQVALSVLEDGLRARPDGGAGAGLARGHLSISRRSRRYATQALLRHMDMADRLGLMTAHLLDALDEQQIAETLATHLPATGIRHLVVGRYSPDEEDAFAEYQIVLRSGAGAAAGESRLPTRRFPPPGLYASDQPFHLALLPLLEEECETGFLAFDAGDLGICAALMRNVAAALRTAKLYRDAAEGRQQAEEASRLKGRFLSTVSHELRTPLNIIVGLSELLVREQAGTTGSVLPDLKRIYASAQHLSLLIRDVLDLASSDAGQLRLNFEALDLAEVLQPLLPVGEQLARDRGLVWRAHVPERVPLIWGDRTRLRQVALNFISNAAKFTEHGAIALDVEVSPDWLTCKVSDTGLGIALEEQELIFDEFRQSERTAGRGFGGLGLGLAISRHLIVAHGGQIGVRSSGALGGGATFYFSLPLLLGSLAGPPSEPSLLELEYRAKPLAPEQLAALLGRSRPGSRPRSVLLVDDEPAVLELHARMIYQQMPEVRVLQARNGRAALALAEEAEPDLILLDLMLPELDGFAVLEALRARPPLAGIPVVVLTSRSVTEDDMARLSRGAVAVVEKGVLSAKETLAHVAQLLEGPRERGRAASGGWLVRQAIAFLHEHYAEPLTREQLAAHVGASASYLADCFHREVGISPMTYLSRYRVKQARAMLEDAHLTVTEVALACGFSDAAYFSRVFQRTTGMAPSEYRRRRAAG